MKFKDRDANRRATRARSQNWRSSGSSTAWWLTLTQRDTKCERCHGMLKKPRDMVWCTASRTALCVNCADADETITYRPSRRWEDARRPKLRGQSGPRQRCDP